ncbi:Ppx/GppA phosphatase [Tindallia magadiensis]|uniref:Exopolyphosphatase n=1 Tax=Tindallia magadiensis TaxID=69895 RepID=A0A1I3EKP1_9FIRM|nr:exopolyphosphatase [Tindallia magadiensis]SFH99537.1 Ppx/GppA phosphatase [Tindallia magadiensis]
MNKKIAVIDLGSNSIRMLLMKVYEDGSYKMLDQVKDMVRLSEGMGEERTLKPLPIKRTMKTLKLFRRLLQVHQTDYVIPVATAAVRSAVNQKMFLEKVEAETGFQFRVITGEEEAYYGYMGVINTLPVERGITIDIGGASTEIGWIEKGRLKESVSLDFGAVTLTEKYIGRENISEEKVQEVEACVEKELEKLEWLTSLKHYPVVGLGGTIRTLAKMDKHKIGYPLESLHNYQMTFAEVEDAYGKVTTGTVPEIRKLPGINKDRADIIAAGLAPVHAIMKKLKTDQLVISGHGVREGVFFEQYLKEIQYPKPVLEDVLFHSADNIIKNFGMNEKHCHRVKKLALALFDQTMELHKMGKKERKLLAVAALFHDLGMSIDYYNHHKHGFYLALNVRVNGLRNYERVMVAFLVGSHRESNLKEDWKQFDMLVKEEDMEKVEKLSLFLKIAEKLDRSEYGSVEDLACYVTKEDVQIMVKAEDPPELEVTSAMTYQKEFKKMYHRKLIIV